MGSDYYGDVFGSEATAADLMQRYNDSDFDNLPDFLRSLCAELWGEDDCDNDFDAMARQIESEAQKEQDFWGHPDTVNLYEGNAGDLYMGYTLGPTWHRLSSHITPGGFAKDAALYEDGLLDTWTDEVDQLPDGAKIVAEYRDGRTRYTLDAYTTSAAPGLAARDYVGPDAEGYEPDDE